MIEGQIKQTTLTMALKKRSTAWYIFKRFVELLISGKTDFVFEAGTREQKCVFDAANIALEIYWSGKVGDIHIDEKRLVYRAAQ